MICVFFVLMFVTRGHRFVISRDVALASIDGGTSRFACARMHARQQGCIRRFGGVFACCYLGSFGCAWERFLAERQQLHHIESEGRTDNLTLNCRTGARSLSRRCACVVCACVCTVATQCLSGFVSGYRSAISCSSLLHINVFLEKGRKGRTSLEVLQPAVFPAE